MRALLVSAAWGLGVMADPSPAKLEKLMCELLSQKEVEDKGVKAACQAITAHFPSLKFNPDCDTVVEALWNTALAKCPQEADLSPADIEKELCELASQKDVEDKAVKAICTEISSKLTVNMEECTLAMKAAWAKAESYCPENETAPSPADIEKMICEVASQKQVEEKAVDEVCQVIGTQFPSVKFNPDCKTELTVFWDKAVAMCTKASPSPADIEKLVCEVASQKQVEDKAVDEVCQVITTNFPSVQFSPDCKTMLTAYWDKAVAMCPQGFDTKKMPSPERIEKMICEVASKKPVEERTVAAVCHDVHSKFPSVKVCEALLGKLWDKAITKCPEPSAEISGIFV